MPVPPDGWTYNDENGAFEKIETPKEPETDGESITDAEFAGMMRAAGLIE